VKKIGIVIPAYRESADIANLCQDILSRYPNAGILVVDDSPDDSSVRAVETLARPEIKIVHRGAKRGRGDAVFFGINQLLKGDYEYFLEMDADFSHAPKEIPFLVSHLEERRLDMVIASRYLAGSRILNWSISRKVFSRCSNFLAKSLLQAPISDYTNGFRLYSRPAAAELAKTCGKLGAGFIALSEILVNLYYRDYKIGEAPTVFVNRVRGESSLSRKEILNALSGLYRVWRLKGRLKK